MGAIRVHDNHIAQYQSFGTGSVHHRLETSTWTMDNQFFIYLQMLKLCIGLFDNHTGLSCIPDILPPISMLNMEVIWLCVFHLLGDSARCPLCRIQGYQSVGKEEDLITVETHDTWTPSKQLTATSYMNHNVKKCVFVLGGGGGGSGSFNYHTADLAPRL